jgi:virulence-associated protein VagC
MTKREIYSVAFNRSIAPDGTVKMYVYTLGSVSLNAFRIPKSITLKDEKITVLFTDNTRHILNYNQDVELFDRIIEPKVKKDPSDKRETK